MPNYIYDLPPLANGTAEKQLQDLRAYLQRMSKQLNAAQDALLSEIQSTGAAGNAATQAATAAVNATVGQTMREQQRTYAQLRELIIKTADEVEIVEDRLTSRMESSYVAKSEFGRYTEGVKKTIEETARGVVESYDYTSRIDDLNGSIDALDELTEELQGRITRGFIEIDGIKYVGIAISEDVRTSSTTKYTENGIEYNEISSGQSYGFYTARGWMFIVNGVRAGYFSAADGTLHVADIFVEDTLRTGNWLITTTGGWGIRYVGG